MSREQRSSNPNLPPPAIVDQPDQRIKNPSKSWKDLFQRKKEQHLNFQEKLFSSEAYNLKDSGCTSGIWKGDPSLTISSAALSRSKLLYEFAVNVKFLGICPSYEDFLRDLTGFKFCRNYVVTSLDFNLAMISFNCEEDMLMLLQRRLWKLGGCICRVYQSRPDFLPSDEPTTAPVWLKMQNPPLFLFDQLILYELGKIYGKPLMMDEATKSLTRPSYARMLVECDLSLTPPTGVWLEIEGKEPYWQSVEREKVPCFCHSCGRIGHIQAECKQKKGRSVLQGTEANKLQHSKMKKEWKKKDLDEQELARFVGEEGFREIPMTCGLNVDASSYNPHVAECSKNAENNFNSQLVGGIRVTPGPLSVAQAGGFGEKSTFNNEILMLEGPDDRGIKESEVYQDLNPEDFKNFESVPNLASKGSGDLSKGEGIFAKMLGPGDHFSDSEFVHLRRNEVGIHSKLTEEDQNLIDKAMKEGRRKKSNRFQNELDMEKEMLNFEIEMLKGENPKECARKELKERLASEARAMKVMDSVSLFSSDFSEIDDWEQWQMTLKEKKSKEGPSSSKAKKPMRFNMTPRRSARFR